jgi:hypothetical protein
MTEVCQVNAKLMLATGERMQAQQREWKMADGRWRSAARTRESSFHEKFRLRGCAVGPDAVFDGDNACFIFTERGVNDPMLRRNVAVDDGVVFLLHGAGLPDFPQFARRRRIFGDDDEAGSFAVEAVDEMRLGNLGLRIANCELRMVECRAKNARGTKVLFHWNLLRKLRGLRAKFRSNKSVPG